MYYPYSTEKAAADKQEATEAGLFFTLDKGEAETLYLASEESRDLKAILETIGFGRSSLLTVMQTVWKESYTYDANSNRLTKTTSWGTIDYNYDRENRLVHSGEEGNGTAFSYDANGNLLTKQNAYKTEQYAYNGLNRMAQSVVTDNIEKTQTTSYYGYDAFGRRTLVQDAGFATMRTLYDGQSFDIIRENEVFGGGDFTTSYMQGSGIDFGTGEVTNERYRYIEGGSTENGRYRNIDGYTTERTRFTGTKTSLYANGESVAVNRSASTSGASGRAYFGTDILGSVRSATTDSSTIEERYEYDAFGTPYKGDFSNGLDGGYTGKPYDATTGLYNYGYRDYSPETARFTTVDPIRDGSNWFSYVVNDPVNYVDLWGLAASDAAAAEVAESTAADEALAETRAVFVDGVVVGRIAPPLGETFADLSGFPVTSPFDPDRAPIVISPTVTTSKGHLATDYRAPEGTRVNAVMDGIVTTVFSQPTGYGTRIIITHPAGNTTLYAHLTEGSTLVKKGDSVVAGQKIAESGNTGSSTNPHLHIAHDATGKGNFTNPEGFISGGGGG